MPELAEAMYQAVKTMKDIEGKCLTLFTQTQQKGSR